MEFESQSRIDAILDSVEKLPPLKVLNLAQELDTLLNEKRGLGIELTVKEKTYLKKKNKNKPGDLKTSKLTNVFVFMICFVSILNYFDVFSFETTSGYDFPILASELKVKNQDELNNALAGFTADVTGLKKKLKQAGYSLEEFQKSVEISFMTELDTNKTLKGLTIEFRSSLPMKKLKPTYTFFAKSVQEHVANYKVNKLQQ